MRVRAGRPADFPDPPAVQAPSNSAPAPAPGALSCQQSLLPAISRPEALPATCRRNCRGHTCRHCFQNMRAVNTKSNPNTAREDWTTVAVVAALMPAEVG